MWEYGLGPWHPFLMIGFIFLCVLVLITVIRMLPGGRRHRNGRGNSALDILNERFARGEIDRTEYEERRRVLDR
jgi:putative membrane protein